MCSEGTEGKAEQLLQMGWKEQPEIRGLTIAVHGYMSAIIPTSSLYRWSSSLIVCTSDSLRKPFSFMYPFSTKNAFVDATSILSLQDIQSETPVATFTAINQSINQSIAVMDGLVSAQTLHLQAPVSPLSPPWHLFRLLKAHSSISNSYDKAEFNRTYDSLSGLSLGQFGRRRSKRRNVCSKYAFHVVSRLIPTLKDLLSATHPHTRNKKLQVSFPLVVRLRIQTSRGAAGKRRGPVQPISRLPVGRIGRCSSAVRSNRSCTSTVRS